MRGASSAASSTGRALLSSLWWNAGRQATATGGGGGRGGTAAVASTLLRSATSASAAHRPPASPLLLPRLGPGRPSLHASIAHLDRGVSSAASPAPASSEGALAAAAPASDAPTAAAPWTRPPADTDAAATPSPSGRTHPLDYTTLAALAAALRGLAVPGKVDEVVQVDAFTVALRVRAEARPDHGDGQAAALPVASTAADVGGEAGDDTPLETLWVWLCWHPAATRVTVGPPPERGGPAEAYGFGRALHSALAGLVLKTVRTPVPFERCVELLFAGSASGPATKALALHGRAGDCGLALVSVTQKAQASRPAAPSTAADDAGDDDTKQGKKKKKDPSKKPSEAALRAQRRSGPPRPAKVSYGQVLAASTARPPPQRRGPGGGGRPGGNRMVPGGNYRPPMLDGRQLVPCPSETAELWRANVVAAAAEADMAEAKRAAAEGGGGDNGGEAGDESSPTAADGPPRKKLDPSVAACLARVYAGVGRAVADELCAVAGLAPAARPADLADCEWAALHAAWTRWLCALSAANFEVGPGVYGRPFSVLGQAGAALRGGPLADSDPLAAAAAAGAAIASRADPHVSLPSLPPSHARALVEAVDAYFRAVKAARAPASLEQHVVLGAQKALRRARDKAAALATQADRAAQAEAKSHAADLLMANVHAISAGATEAIVTDWESGEEMTIPLGDGRTPVVDVAAGLYKEARRLRRGDETVGPLLEAARADVSELEGLVAQLEALPPAASSEGGDDSSSSADRTTVLQEVRAALEGRGWLPQWREAGLEARGAAAAKRAARREGGGRPDGAPNFRRFTSPSGLAVLVGRNNRDNDTLSLRVAGPDDVWLHARGVPGAHVVLRAPQGEQGGPLDEDVRFAAALAAFFSKARDGGSVDVSHTLARNVKKPRGAPAGLVTLLAESVVRVRPDDVAGVVADTSAEGSGGED